MSGMDKLKATTSSSGKQSLSLSQLLRSSRSNVGGTGRKPLPSLEDLQKKLASSQTPVNTRLNLSKALSLNPSDGAFEDKSSLSSDYCDVQVNGAFGTKMNPKQLKNLKEEGKAHQKGRSESFSKYNMDLEKIIDKIEKTKTVFFEEEAKPDDNRSANFSCIRLPKQFNPTRGHVNVYRSGLIEIVNKDSSEVHRFRKDLFETSTTTTTDLIILNDTLQMTEPINILQQSTT